MLLYHGSNQIVQEPRLGMNTKYGKDFGPGFYCTTLEDQAIKWSYKRARKGTPILNIYEMYNVDHLDILEFETASYDWLDFVVACRKGKRNKYIADIITGPMADDTIWNFIDLYIAKVISKEDMSNRAEFSKPTNQVVFCTKRALDSLEFRGYEYV